MDDNRASGQAAVEPTGEIRTPRIALLSLCVEPQTRSYEGPRCQVPCCLGNRYAHLH